METKTITLYRAILEITEASKEDLELVREHASMLYMKNKNKIKKVEGYLPEREENMHQEGERNLKNTLDELKQCIKNLSILINGLDSEKTEYQKFCESMGIK